MAPLVPAPRPSPFSQISLLPLLFSQSFFFFSSKSLQTPGIPMLPPTKDRILLSL